MIGDLLKRLTTPAPAPLSRPEADLALAALLVRVARSDGDYARAEMQKIDRILMARLGSDAQTAQALRAEGEQMEAQAPDTVRFTRAIKDAVPHEDRIEVIEALWTVALADGVRDEEESGMLRLLANLLGVNDRDSNLARQRVERRT